MRLQAKGKVPAEKGRWICIRVEGDAVKEAGQVGYEVCSRRDFSVTGMKAGGLWTGRRGVGKPQKGAELLSDGIRFVSKEFGQRQEGGVVGAGLTEKLKIKKRCHGLRCRSLSGRRIRAVNLALVYVCASRYKEELQWDKHQGGGRNI